MTSIAVVEVIRGLKGDKGDPGPTGGSAVQSVNTKSGDVVLTQDDIASGTTNKQYTATEKTKLSGIATGATANDTDANLKNRANHTGTQLSSTISDLTEAVQDAVAALLSGTSGVTLSYNDAANTLTISGPGAVGLDAEAVRDAIGIAMVGAGNINIAVNDAADTITVSTTATVNSTDAALRDRSTHTGTQSADTLTDGTTNKAFLATERTKLSGIATGATANATDAALRDRTTHTGTQSADTVVDGTTNKAYTATEKTKLSGIATGATANDTDVNLRDRSTHTGTQTADTITDGTTNKAYTATEKTKLSGIANGATANASDSSLLSRSNHTGVQSADTLTDGTTNKAFLATERTKLSGIAGGATANDTDANLKNRANHTGTQLSSTISDLTEVTQDNIGAFLQQGSNISLNYNDVANTLSISAILGTSVATFPVSEYGAVGDGVTNDTAAIQAALNAAAAAGGGRVELARGKLYGWSGVLTVPTGVTLAGSATRQNLAANATPSVPGLVALNANCQLKVGDWSGAAASGGISHVYVDGNFVGGSTPTKKGLVRIAGVNLLINNLFVTRSAGDNIVYDGLQNSTVIGGMSTMAVGSSIVMDNGAGAISFLGGYYGTSKGGLLTCRDTAGEGNLYPFGPTQNTWTGTIFEAYSGQAAPIAESYDHIIHISGTQNAFVNCNFTGGAINSANATVLIDNTVSAISNTTSFHDCLFWVRQGYDAIRVAASAVLNFTGTQNVSDDGTHHATSFIALDNASPHISIDGEINMNGDVNGANMFRVIGTGTTSQIYTKHEGGYQYRMQANQVVSYRRAGDVAHRGYIDRDFTLAWYDGTVSAPGAYIQRGVAGTGAGLDFGTAAGGEFKFIGGGVRVPSLYFGSSVTPFDPSVGGADKDTVLLNRLERQARQRIDSYNRKVVARHADSTVFTELWENTSNWTGSATVANGQMYNAAAALSRGISMPVGAGRRIIRGVITLTSSSNYAYLGVSSDAVGAAVTLGNTALIGISSSTAQASIGANITGTASNPISGVKSAGDYLATVVIDEESISFSLQAISNPGVTINSFSLLRSQFPGGAINNIVVSCSSTTTGLVWGPLQDITEITPPPKAQQAPSGKVLWGAAAPIHINHKSPGHQIVEITGIGGGTFTLTYAGQTTPSLAWDITGPDLKTALENLSTIGPGNAAVNKAGQKWAVRLKGPLGLVPITATESIPAGDVAITQSSVRWFMQIPGDYDPRTPIPFVQYLHWSLTSTGIQIYTDARWTSTFNNLISAGYAFLSSDNGPLTTAGGLQDSFGNQYGIDEYADQVDWFRRHFNTGSLFLIGASQGGIFVENILASRKYNAVGNIAAVASVSPARDLNAVVPNPTFTSVFEDAYGASSTADFAVKVAGYNPIDLKPQQLRGVPHRDYVATADATTDEAVQSTPFLNALDGWVPEHPMWTNGSSTHLDSGLFVQMATEIVSYFDTYNTTDHSAVGSSTNKGTTKRVYTTASTATLTPDVDNYDIEIITGQTAGLTVAAPVGTLNSGSSFILRIKDDGTARAISWNSIYRALGVTLPTTTVAGKTMYVAIVWNSVSAKWDVIAVAQEA